MRAKSPVSLLPSFLSLRFGGQGGMSCAFFLPPAAHVSAELMIKAVGHVFTRTWVLLLGMSGLILLFWFLKGGEVLRFLVSFFLGRQEEVLL